MNKNTYCKLIWDWGKARIVEPSTIRGLVMATAAGVVAVAPALAVKVGTIAASIVGVIDVFTKESQK